MKDHYETLIKYVLDHHSAAQSLNEFERTNLCDEILLVLTTNAMTRGAVANLDGARAEAKEDYEETLANIDAKLANVQAECKHLCTTFHGDPSGNGDNETVCEICRVRL